MASGLLVGSMGDRSISEFLTGSVPILAHPDDEILWAASALTKAGRAIRCFEDVPFCLDTGAAHRRVIVGFPAGGYLENLHHMLLRWSCGVRVAGL